MAPFLLNALPGQLKEMDDRITRIENALDQILLRLAMPTLNSVSSPLEPEKAIEVAKVGPYIYKPLDASKYDIRVLVLHSSPADNDPIKAELEIISLEEKPGSLTMGRMFKALSYTWGDATKTVDITIEGHQFSVTENLFAALKNVRNLPSINSSARTGQAAVSYWWIDAICINQQDVLERNSQVAMMTRIYKKCYTVHVWLGEQADESDLAMKLVERLSEIPKKGPGELEIVYPECSMDEKVRHWKALTKLYQRPWWERVWIRQEVAVPKSAAVQCGTKTCSFDQICNVAAVLHSMEEQLGYQPAPLQGYHIDQSSSTSGTLRISCYLRASMLHDLRNGIKRGMSGTFGDMKDLLYHTRSCKSTDPRDKVYSVFGLVDLSLYEVKPDYRIALDEVLKTTTRAVILAKQSLDILAGSQNPGRQNGLPSWVLNITEEWKARPLTAKNPFSRMPETPEFNFDPDNNSILRAKGRLVSTIAAISPDVVTAIATTEDLDALYQNWKMFILEMTLHKKLDYEGKRDYRLYTEKQPDRKWLEFLSLNAEIGHWLRYSADGKLLADSSASGKLLTGLVAKGVAWRDTEMINSLLLPKSTEEGAIEDHPYKRYHANLRKNAIGRKLAYLKNGRIGLVPGEIELGDEVCVFSNTYFCIVLRKVEDDKHVVVGEAFFPSLGNYQVPTKDGYPIPLSTFSIV